jgi:peroxiredoxin (alkyl hydroperoxide reductase subunit C)
MIDPEGILRTSIYCSISNGRSTDEFLRLLKALQFSDAKKFATPEAWKQGDAMTAPPPKTVEVALALKDKV